MPLPLLLGGAAAIAGVVGIGSAVHGGVKMKEANDTMKLAENKHKDAIARFEAQNKKTTPIWIVWEKWNLRFWIVFSVFLTFLNRFTIVRNLSPIIKKMSASRPIMQKN